MYRKLGKKTKLRKALLRNQVTALIYHGKITTTEARAKEIRKIVCSQPSARQKTDPSLPVSRRGNPSGRQRPQESYQEGRPG